MCNILTFVDWWVKSKIWSWSLQIWLKNTLDRDLPMMKLLLLFNEFFLHLSALHQNLKFLEQTCTFLHLLTQIISLSYVCFIRRSSFFILPWLVLFSFFFLFFFAVAFLFLPWFFCFVVIFLFCRCFLVLPWLFYFAVAFLFCRGFFIFALIFLFCCGFFILPWLFCFAVAFLFCCGFFILPWVFTFAVAILFCRGYFSLPWIFHFAMAVLCCRGFALSWLFVLPWLFGFAVTLRPIRKTFDGKIAWYHKVFETVTLQPRDKHLLFLKRYLESTVSKCACLYFGFGDFSGKNNCKQIIDCKSVLQRV